MAWMMLAVVVQAGPLDNPDQEEMHGFRCVDRPLEDAIVAPLRDRTVGAGSPGPPLISAPVLAKLAPFSDDDAMKKASSRHVTAVDAVASLATGGQPVIASCESRSTTRDDFTKGCPGEKRPMFRCDWYAHIDGTRTRLDGRPQVALRFAPVTTLAEAVGLLRFHEPNLFLPLTPGEKQAWESLSVAYKAVEPPVVWLEVTAYDQGWLIHAPRKAICGCNHDVVRQAYWVARDGRSCALNEPAVPLAVHPDSCVAVPARAMRP